MRRCVESLQGIIQVISLIIETRDPYTAGHQRSVADLARAIALVMGLPPERIEGIRLAAIVHDLGKISIPAEILAKPSRLTEAEMSMIRIHPRSGYEILRRVEFPWPIAQIVLQHHERIDGSGYPQGLRGPDILLEAKILGVADVVDAMCSHRPYRPAIGIDKALAEISQNRGILYDPEVVDACLKYFQEKLATLPITKKSYKHLISSQPHSQSRPRRALSTAAKSRSLRLSGPISAWIFPGQGGYRRSPVRGRRPLTVSGRFNRMDWQPGKKSKNTIS